MPVQQPESRAAQITHQAIVFLVPYGLAFLLAAFLVVFACKSCASLKAEEGQFLHRIFDIAVTFTDGRAEVYHNAVELERPDEDSDSYSFFVNGKSVNLSAYCIRSIEITLLVSPDPVIVRTKGMPRQKKAQLGGTERARGPRARQGATGSHAEVK